MMGLFKRVVPADLKSKLVSPSKEFLHSYKAAVAEGLPDDCKDFKGIFRLRRCIRCLNSRSFKHTLWLVQDREVLGSIVLTVLPPDDDSATVEYDIRQSIQGRGYGKLILKLGLEKLRELGVRQALLSVKPENSRSIRVIEKNGGRHVGEGFLGLNYVINISGEG